MKTFLDYGIKVKGNSGQEKTTCPQCSAQRRKSNDKCLSVNLDENVWNCFHCGFNGGLSGNNKIYIRPQKPKPTTEDKVLKWFASRGISKAVVEHNGIGYSDSWIAFPFFRNGETINIKYRSGKKEFRQTKDAEKIFYGMDDIDDWAIIVEGEMDVLSFEEAGFKACMSVPDGAPSPNSKSYANKFEYIENCEELINGLDRIVLAVDSDEAGQTLEAELIRRLGPEKCWRVTWPEGCKDANEVLVKLGKEALQEVLQSASPVPIEGIFEVNHLSKEIDSLYQDGMKGGLSTGWLSVDDCYTVKTGEWTVITGIPSHGKSSWLDALLINLAEIHDWNFAIFSPENQPLQRHIAGLMQKYSGVPFGNGPSMRMDKEEMQKAKEWLQERFVFILPSDTELSVDAILDKAKTAVTRYGIKGLVLDPWNEFDHSRPAGMTEPEYISDCLTKIRRFARKYDLHIWVVAHPTKLQKGLDGNYPIPTPYDIAGAAHWRNKADNCITVWRDLTEQNQEVEIHIQKVRFREVGKVGLAKMNFEITTGRYSGL